MTEFSGVSIISRVPLGRGLGISNGACWLGPWTGGHEQPCGEKRWWSGGWRMLLGAGDIPGHGIPGHYHLPTVQTKPLDLRFPQRLSFVLGRAAAKLAWRGKCSLT